MLSRLLRHQRQIVLTATLLGLTTLPSHAEAQSLAQQTRDAGSSSTHILAINPFLPLFGYFQGEYERRLQDNLSLAIAGSHVRYDEYYTNFDVKLRLYPQDKALDGFGIAGGIGVGSAKPTSPVYYCDADECGDREARRVTAPTFSVEAQYQWLLGRTRRTAVSFGGGAKRYFFTKEDTQDRLQRVLPTARFTIGYVFR
ncbi:MAG: hypothetical protein IBJ03_08865 [Gemmatimonadaceae bacterium]|nr:hypothetical protein [Gemmatimonadaceae bacterium]